MKNEKLFLIIIVFAVVVIAALAGYNYLSENYKPQGNISIETDKPAAQSEEENVLAPEFSVVDENENQVDFSEFKGKPIVINFWATWCGFCVNEFPAFESVYNEYKDEVNFMMINVTDGQQETLESASAFIKENNYTFPVFYDTELNATNIYGAYSIPITVLIDADGYYLGTHQGAMDEETLRNYIKSLIGG